MEIKITINEEGMLVVNNKNKNCPFAPFEADLHTAESYCGDWCALFGEPEPTDSALFTQKQIEEISSGTVKVVYKDESIGIRLQLCHKTLYCKKEDFTDLRK